MSNLCLFFSFVKIFFRIFKKSYLTTFLSKRAVNVAHLLDQCKYFFYKISKLFDTQSRILPLKGPFEAFLPYLFSKESFYMTIFALFKLFVIR